MITLNYKIFVKHNQKKSTLKIKLYLNNKIIKTFENLNEMQVFKIIKELEKKHNIFEK